MRRQLIKFLSTEARRAGQLRGKLEKVEVWTQQRRIPSNLTRRIRAYYAEIWLDYAGVPWTPLSHHLVMQSSCMILIILGTLPFLQPHPPHPRLLCRDLI